MIRFIVYLMVMPFFLFSQPYLGKQAKTRHRFAQTVFGLDVQNSLGGNSAFVNSLGAKESFRLNTQIKPRLYVSGIHFWGHMEFYFAVQLYKKQKIQYRDIYYNFSQSDIFGTKIYPWVVQRNKLRPYLGFSISGLNYSQFNKENGKGLTLVRVKIPILAGLNYCTGPFHFDLGISYNYDNKVGYYITENQKTTLSLPPLMIGITFKKWFETTASAEKEYLDGTTEKKYNKLSAQKKLSSWFFGIGPSSAFFTKLSLYNEARFAYMEKPNAAFFPEVSAGYFYEPYRLHFGSAFRHNRSSKSGYDVTQKHMRTSLAFESFKYLFDYHGFNPYLGICSSIEQLRFTHMMQGYPTFTQQKTKAGFGVIFGWDICPNKLQWFTLRTNLRYFPNLHLAGSNGNKISFDQLEFNFIQMIFYPTRKRNLKV